jgi:hypothetical protein
LCCDIKNFISSPLCGDERIPIFLTNKEKTMEEVQSYVRPLAYSIAKTVEKQEKNSMLNSTQTLQFSGAPEAGGDVIYDF